MRAVLAALCCAVLYFAAGSILQGPRLDAQSAATVTAPAPRATVVRVDVIASDARGRAVENLKPNEFEVTENGVRQTLDSVRFAKIDRRPAAEANPADLAPIRSEFDEQEQAGLDGTRLVAILLDEYHVS